jgi:hypothetical protein
VKWIDDQYPDAVGRYQVTSEWDDNYNCIGFAITNGKLENWNHLQPNKWIGQRTPSIHSLVRVCEARDFKRCGMDMSLEPGFEKIALYELRGMYTHAARQLPDGRWKSKLGEDEDIEHDTPECLCGKFYGQVHCIMRRELLWAHQNRAATT